MSWQSSPPSSCSRGAGGSAVAPGAFLPTSPQEAGGAPLDVVLVTGDAYVDAPSFGAAMVGRWLEHHGLRVGIISQPPWSGPEAFRALGRPRLFFGVTAGNLDSMVAAFTSSGRKRREDAYSPGGEAGMRPLRASLVYAARCREAFPGVPVILGGVEASLRRLAHHDWWQGKVRRSVLLDARADLLVFGMAERTILEVARRLAGGHGVEGCRDLPGIAFAVGARGDLPSSSHVELPPFEAVAADPLALNEATRLAWIETNPLNARPLLQRHGEQVVWVNPPPLPLSSEELDAAHSLPFRHEPHPRHRGPIPAWDATRGSVTVVRGCGGGCSFCALGLHQGREVTSRSAASVTREVERLAGRRDFRGVITDLGGPTANMYGAGCGSPEARAACRRTSCLHPGRCPHFLVRPGALQGLIRRAARVQGVRHVFVGSGLRHDLFPSDPELLPFLLDGHVSGRFTVAPEHACDDVLRAMRKPGVGVFEDLLRRVQEASRGLPRPPVMVPYLVAGHPGAGPRQAVELALYLKERDIRPRQVQLFLPTPGTISTAMYVSGRDPFTAEELYVARSHKERAWQRALMLWWKEEEAPTIREALRAWGRGDLIGDGAGCLVRREPRSRSDRPRRPGKSRGRRS